VALELIVKALRQTTWRGSPLNLLSSVLPGLRALRAPIVSGFLWIAAALIYALSHKIRIQVNTHDVNSALTAARTWFLTAIIPAALTIAYLIGIVMTGITTPLMRRLIRAAHRLTEAIDDPYPYWKYSGTRRYILRQLDRFSTSASRGLSPISLAARGFIVDYILTAITGTGASIRAALCYPIESAVRSIQHNSMQLAETAPTQYQEYDRLQAEADFRLGIIPPLLVIGIAMPWNPVVSIAVAVAASVVLLAQSVSQARAAIEIVALSMFQGYASIVPVKLTVEYLKSLDPKPDSDGVWVAQIVIGLNRYGFSEESDEAAGNLPQIENDETERTAREFILRYEPGYVNVFRGIYGEGEDEEANQGAPSLSSSSSSLHVPISTDADAGSKFGTGDHVATP
jgi:hypothetical protein